MSISFAQWAANLENQLLEPLHIEKFLVIKKQKNTLRLRWYEERFDIAPTELWNHLSSPTLNISDDIRRWAFENLPVTAGEFSLHGNYELTVNPLRWRAVVRRVEGRKIYSREFITNDFLPHKKLEGFFDISQVGSLMTIQSKYDTLSSTAALYHLEELSEHIDLSNDLRFLVSYHTDDPVHIGHERVITRFSQGIERYHSIISVSQLLSLKGKP